MKQILFSCIGTTDPVRGEHDGPMLHILRHYRPEKAYLFFTPEIRALAEQDSRMEKTLAWICQNWNGYRPKFTYVDSDIKNAHDIDALDQPLHDAMAQISRENPDAEILINVTSGTPQMQMILSQFAMDIRYRTKGIQVTNFEEGAGQAQRTNHREYYIELELQFNEDELPGAKNRCGEPEMYAIRREYLRRQITALLDERNFEAVEQLKDSLPENIRNLILHLAARNRLQSNKAKQLAGEVTGLPFKLYAYKTGSRSQYSQVSEYYLLMKNLVKAGNCTEFLLHMEPMTLTLQKAMLDKLLLPVGLQMSDFLNQDRRGREIFVPSRLKNKYPDLYQHYSREQQSNYRDVIDIEINTYICDVLLCFFHDIPNETQRLFAQYNSLKDLRNRLAHDLCTVTEGEIKAACGAAPKKLLEELESTIIACYPACDPVIFSVYDKCIDYIKNSL